MWNVISIYIDDELNIKVKCLSEDIRLLKVACIFDSFTMKCYDTIVNLMPISYNNWYDEIIKINRIYFLLNQRGKEIIMLGAIKYQIRSRV